MCGIYGTNINFSDDQIKSKIERIKHRGPDHSGIKEFSSNYGKIKFAHNRLSIIDLDPRSNQPFTYAESIHLTYNGEIYNYLELKKRLISKGYNFKTSSDTEVICAAYLEYREHCVNYFNGMFSFVIYDAKNEILFGARDRLGQKPLYYFHHGDEFEFASQIAAIKLFRSNLNLSQKAIEIYRKLGYIPDPISIFKEIRKLQAGHFFLYDLSNGNFKDEKYWDLDSQGLNKFEGSYDSAKLELEKILISAVENRLISDVPLGIFLSGGIDSSLIASIAKKISPNNVKTFAIKFNNKGFDESPYAEQVAKHLSTEHYTIECNYNEGIDLIKNFSYYYDEPFSDSSAIPSMLLAKKTREYVTVALSGDAGDENFLGYHRYNWVKIAMKYFNSPTFIQYSIRKLLTILPYYKFKVIYEVLKNKNINEAYLSIIGASFLLEDFNNDSFPKDEYLNYLLHENKNIFERISDFDLKTYLNGDINTKVDRATMAFSLEARSPFMDFRVVDFSRSLPTEFKFHNNNQKRILKDILYQYVPEKYFNRPKAGFTMPFKEWFRNELKDYVLDELNDESLVNMPGVDINRSRMIIDQHMNGTWNRYPEIWNLLVLKQWIKSNSN